MVEVINAAKKEKEQLLELRNIESSDAFKQMDTLRQEKQVLLDQLEQLQRDYDVCFIVLIDVAISLLTRSSKHGVSPSSRAHRARTKCLSAHVR
jgi:hypothetical protein